MILGREKEHVSRPETTCYLEPSKSTKFRRKQGNSLIYSMRVSAGTSVPHQKIVGHVKKRGSSAKWNHAVEL
jgi:hypothetical protein